MDSPQIGGYDRVPSSSNLFDDTLILLDRYAAKHGDLPEWLTIETETTYKEGERPSLLPLGPRDKIFSLRLELSKLSAEKIAKPEILISLLTRYPRVKKSRIAALWLYNKWRPVTKVKPVAKASGKPIAKAVAKVAPDLKSIGFYEAAPFLTMIDPSFVSEKRVIQILEDLETEIKTRTTDLQQRITEIDKHQTILSGLDQVNSSDFVAEEITIRLIWSLPTDTTLLEIFKTIRVSKEIPFVMLNLPSRYLSAISKGGNNIRYYKVYRGVVPPESWLDPPRLLTELPCIQFKILNAPPRFLHKKMADVTDEKRLDELYSDGFWFSDSRTELNFRLRPAFIETDMIAYLTDALKISGEATSKKEGLQAKIISVSQLSVRGQMTIPNRILSQTLWADFLETSDLARYFIFINEREKTILTKRNFFVYYGTGHSEIPTPGILGLKFLQHDNDIVIKVSRATTVRQATAARAVLSKLFAAYDLEEKSLAKIYSNLIENFIAPKPIAAKAAPKTDRKTGKRARELRNAEPSLFRPRYPDECQRQAHPYIVPEDQVTALKKKLGGGDPIVGDHKVMFFEGRWYACDPREPDDKHVTKEHLWPGLKPNRTDDMAYRAAHPNLPCCYAVDQYTKKGSQLNKWLAEQGMQTEKEPVKKKEGGLDYVVKPTNPAPDMRFGELPFYWEKLLTSSLVGIYPKVTRSKGRIFYPLLRTGLPLGPDSFLKCLIKATDDKIGDADEKIESVLKLRKSWISNIKSKKGAAGAQELAGMSSEDLIEILSDPHAYIDPDIWVSVAAFHYKVNIFLYVIDALHPDGEIVIPRSTRAYLAPPFDLKQPSIFIFKFERLDQPFPYQCEVMGEIIMKKDRFSSVRYLFPDSPLVRVAASLFAEANEVFVVGSDAYELYAAPKIT